MEVERLQATCKEKDERISEFLAESAELERKNKRQQREVAMVEALNEAHKKSLQEVRVNEHKIAMEIVCYTKWRDESQALRQKLSSNEGILASLKDQLAALENPAGEPRSIAARAPIKLRTEAYMRRASGNFSDYARPEKRLSITKLPDDDWAKQQLVTGGKFRDLDDASIQALPIPELEHSNTPVEVVKVPEEGDGSSDDDLEASLGSFRGGELMGAGMDPYDPPPATQAIEGDPPNEGEAPNASQAAAATTAESAPPVIETSATVSATSATEPSPAPAQPAAEPGPAQPAAEPGPAPGPEPGAPGAAAQGAAEQRGEQRGEQKGEQTEAGAGAAQADGAQPAGVAAPAEVAEAAAEAVAAPAGTQVAQAPLPAEEAVPTYQELTGRPADAQGPEASEAAAGGGEAEAPVGSVPADPAPAPAAAGEAPDGEASASAVPQSARPELVRSTSEPVIAEHTALLTRSESVAVMDHPQSNLAASARFEEAYAEVLQARPRSTLHVFPEDDLKIEWEDPQAVAGVPMVTPDMRPIVADCVRHMTPTLIWTRPQYSKFYRDSVTTADQPDPEYEFEALKESRDGREPGTEVAHIRIPEVQRQAPTEPRHGLYHFSRVSYMSPPKIRPLCLPAGSIADGNGCRFIVEPMSLEFEIYNEADADFAPEPFFCELALYDSSNNTRLSASHYFHLNNAATLASINFGEETRATAASCRRAIFNVHSRADSIVLILRVSKILQGSADAGTDPYTKIGKKVSAKSREKIAKSLADAVPRLCPFRQPFAWAMAPVFSSGGEFALTTEPMHSLYRDKGLENLTIMQMCSDLLNPKKKPPKNTIPGMFVFKTTEVVSRPNFKFYNTYLQHVIPPGFTEDVKGAKDAIQIQAFPHNPDDPSAAAANGSDVFHGFRHSLSLAMVGTTLGRFKQKMRNVAVRIELFPDDNMETAPLRSICGQGLQAGDLVDHLFTHVHYHNKTPPLRDFIQVNLPVHLTGKEHLLFTFYHLTIRKLKKDEEMLTPAAYAVLPLIVPSSVFESGNVIDTGNGRDLQLPLMGSLSPGYLQNTDVGVVDPSKEGLRVRTIVESTVHPGDPRLSGLYHVAPSSLGDAVVSARSLPPSLVVAFLPVILDKLLDSLPDRPTLSSGAAGRTVLSITSLCFAIHPKSGDNGVDSCHPVLSRYVQCLMSLSTVHTALCVGLSQALNDPDSDKGRGALLFAWVPMSLAARSLFLKHEKDGTLGSTDRRTIRDPEWHVALEDCVRSVARGLATCPDAAVARSAAAALGAFLCEMLRVEDRGLTMALAQEAVNTISSSASARLASQSFTLKFDLLRAVCMFPHYLSLNLPASFIDGLHFAEEERERGLVALFEEKHFLATLLAKQVVDALDPKSLRRDLRRVALAVLADVLARGEHDGRLVGEAETSPSAPTPVSRGEAMHAYGIVHFALVQLLLENHDKLIEWRVAAEIDEHRELCQAVLFILKSVRVPWVHTWFVTLSAEALERFVLLLRFCVDAFEHTAVRPEKSEATVKEEQMAKEKTDIENFYQKHHGRRFSNLRDRSLKKDKKDGSLRRGSGSGADSPTSPHSEDSFEDTEARPMERKFKRRMKTMKTKKKTDFREVLATEAFGSSGLCQEAAFVVVDLAVMLIDYAETMAEEGDAERSDQLLTCLNALIIDLMSTSQSVAVHERLYPVVRRLVSLRREHVFRKDCKELEAMVRAALLQCNFEQEGTRTCATAFMYFMLKQNFFATGDFRQMIAQVTLSLSKLLADGTFRDHYHLQRALNCVSRYALVDSLSEGQSQFHTAVAAFNVRMASILENTLHINKERLLPKDAQDPDLLVEMFHTVVKCYHPSPDLRLQWSEALAKYHEEQENFTEAALCRVAMAALIAEAWSHVPGVTDVPFDFDFLQKRLVPTYKLLTDGAELAELTKSREAFAREKLVVSLEEALALYSKAKFYEQAVVVAQFLVHIHTAADDWPRLNKTYGELEQSTRHIAEGMHQENARNVGDYFRIGFFTPDFPEYDGKEYVYKAKPFTHLFTYMAQLETMLKKKFGGHLEVIKDSAPVVKANLDPTMCYVQITAVYPKITENDPVPRKSFHERNTFINRFVFDTPFTKSGRKAQAANSAEQWMRYTILETEETFPSLVTRCLVVGKEEEETSPLQNSIVAIQDRIVAIQVQIDSRNSKLLPNVLQGSVLLQVNAGVMEICEGFLSESARTQWPEDQVLSLSTELSRFLDTCGRGLKISAELLGNEQAALQNMMEKGYAQLEGKMRPYLRLGG